MYNLRQYIIFNPIILIKMKNFKRFEQAYAALIKAHQALITIPYWCITIAGEDTFRAQRLEALKEIVEARNLLKQWFKEHFPKTRADAFHSDQFTFPAFFEMLKKYPELAEENKEALQCLLCNLKTGPLSPTGLDEIPDISEFVK